MKNYAVTVSFLDPVEGVAYISAADANEAENKAKELFQNRTNLAVVDISEQGSPALDMFDILDIPTELN